ncbi:hypothetical protein ACLB2K_058526 [Fragaria x ananassa]
MFPSVLSISLPRFLACSHCALVAPIAMPQRHSILASIAPWLCPSGTSCHASAALPPCLNGTPIALASPLAMPQRHSFLASTTPWLCPSGTHRHASAALLATP